MLILQIRLAKMYQLFNNDLQQDVHEWIIYETLERVTSIPITNDINVAIFKEFVSGLINNFIICTECKCKTRYRSTMCEIIVNIRSIYILQSKTHEKQRLVKHVQNISKVKVTN